MSKRPITVEDLWSLKFPGAPRISPDGEHIIFTLTEIDVAKNGYRSTLWILDKIEGGWSEARQFTTHQITDRLVRDTQPNWSACSRFIFFMSNRSGRNQIWRINVDGGEAKQVTSWEENIGEIAWSKAVPGLIAFTSRVPGSKVEDDNPDMRVITNIRYKFNGMGFLDQRPKHIFTLNLKTMEYTQVTDGQFSESAPAFSPDGQWIAFSGSRIENDEINEIQNIWRVPVSGGTIEQLTFNEGSAGAPQYSPDGQWIAYLGHEKGQGKSGLNTNILIRPADGGASQNLTEAHDYTIGNNVGGDSRADGGTSPFFWNDDSQSILTIIAERGEANIYQLNLTGESTLLTTGKHSITSFSAIPGREPGKPRIVYILDCYWNASEVFYRCPVREQSFRLTTFNQPLLSDIAIGDIEELDAHLSDGYIHGWLIKPINFDPSKKYPMILHVHGGPYGASGYGFFHEYQLMASRGYAVLISNPRGSATYGEKHSLGVIGDWGDGDYRDLMAIIDKALEQNSWLDPERLGVTGGSYGGYMTNWMVSQTDRFKAAVSIRSISNMYTKYGVSDIGWYGNRAGFAGRDLWDSEDFIMSRSPIRYAPNVKTPIMLIQSEEDYRCTMEQAEQWFTALKRLGVTTEFVRFKGENHELSRSGKPKNRADRLRQIMRWFETYLPANKE